METPSDLSTVYELLAQARDAISEALPMAEEEWGHYPSTCNGGVAIEKMRTALAAIDDHLATKA